MTIKLVWILIFLTLYCSYCIYVGFKVSANNKTASDFFISERKLPALLFLFTATAASFSGSVFLVLPGLIFRDGFQAAYISFCVIVIPFAGILFFKRQWILGKRFGYTTPVEMFADYFQGKMIRILTIIIALSFSIPFLGLQLAASGKLFNFLSNDVLNLNITTWVLAFILLLYVILGGLRSVAYLSILQSFLIWIGIISIGFITLKLIGGWNIFNESLANISQLEGTRWNKSPTDNYSAYFAIPDIVQLTPGIGKATPVGGIWTGVMILTYVLGFMGIQSSPAFSMLVFSSKDPKPFAPQQVWFSAFIIGIALFLFSIIQGMAAHFLGADQIVNKSGINITNLLPNSIGNGGEGNLVLYLINSIENTAPWFLSFLAICALAAMQSTGALLISTGSSIITRDIYNKYFKTHTNDNEQKFIAKIFSFIIVLLSLTIISFSEDFLILLGSVTIPLGFQMCIPLIAICYVPWLTKHGVSWGLLAGILGVLVTDNIGQVFLSDIVPWGVWPFTIYSAFWGILINLIVTVLISIFTQKTEERLHKKKYHDFLNYHAPFPNSKKILKFSITILFVFSWFFFAIGPGAIIGNDIFGIPNDKNSWLFKIPSIWAWQILLWILGVGMMWFLAYKMEMSTETKEKIDQLNDFH
jgi:Na+/proline symporter